MSESSPWCSALLNTDGYKHALYSMYPRGTEYVSAYFESRGGPYAATMFVGLQAFLREYLTRPITIEDVDEAEEIVARGFGARFNRQMWVDLVNDHGGYLPVEIEAVPEGTVVPTRNVLLQVVNTDPKYPWVITFIETALQRALWYPTSVGTLSWMMKQFMREMLERTSDHPEAIRLYLHDYGARGVSSLESSALGGMAHLVNFDQTDTVAGYIAAVRYYNAVISPNCGTMFQEHSVLMARGPEHEAESFRTLLKDSAFGVVGLLVDTYDHFNAVRNILGKELHDEVLGFPGLVAIRCDSGDAVLNPVDTVEALMENFEFTTNSKGFKLLPPNIRVVQGDGLGVDTFSALYLELERRGLAADNVLCGMGGGLLQRVNRDLLNFGFKANAIRIDGEWRDIAKVAKGTAMKRSKAGRLALQYVDGDYRTVPRGSISSEQNALVPVFRDGMLLRTWDFAELIERSERPTPDYYYADVGKAVAEVS